MIHGGGGRGRSFASTILLSMVSSRNSFCLRRSLRKVRTLALRRPCLRAFWDVLALPVIVLGRLVR